MKHNKEVLPVIQPKEVMVGDPSAPVTIMMFGDYESEATAKATQVISELLEKYKGKINFNFRHFPLTRIHQKAHKAAEAAIGAAQEGKFWEMHQILLSNRHNLGVISLKSYAREAGVKDKRFLEHLINSIYGWYVQDDLKYGLKLGVTEVPTLFVNNQRFEKEPTIRNIKAHIDLVLSQDEKKRA